ncbi:outer membrane beta-barrel protein [Burkholderiaceae bacterium UC74_6]
MAQSSSSSSSSWLPYTTGGYVGLNLGRTKFDMGCGLGGFSCDSYAKTAVNLYTGGMFNDYMGLELGYLHTGNLDRAGGTTSAQGVNLLLVGRVPLGAFNIFAKAGGIYGRTKVSTDTLSGIPGGSKSGGGLSVAGGMGYDLSPKSSIVVQWARNKFKFANEGHPNVDTTSIGYVYRF